MHGYEVQAYDGLSRKGTITTKHGIIQTPTIFPVNDFCPQGGWDTIKYWNEFPEINTGMFNTSLLVLNSPARVEKMLHKGVHQCLGFPGVAFFDSGGWVYSNYKPPVGQRTLLTVQERVGADIASSLDFPLELTGSSPDRNISRSVFNARILLENRKDERMLVYASIHGYDPLLVRNVIRYLKRLGDFDGFALGSMLRHYSNYELLVDLTYAARQELPDKPLHVYGLSGPKVAAILALLGVDSVDSAGFAIAASRKRYIAPGFRTYSVKAITRHRDLCDCRICQQHTIDEMRRSKRLLALHNVGVLWREMTKIRETITEGRLESYLEKGLGDSVWGRVALRYARHRVLFGQR